MAYRLPQFMFLHAAQDAGVGSITANNAVDSDYPLAHLIDNRPSSLMKFDASESDHWIKIDRGAAGLEALDRLIIPAGHNLNPNCTFLAIQSNTSDSFPGGSTRGSIATPPNAMIDLDLTEEDPEHRWLFINFTGSDAYELGQLFFSHSRVMTTRGPDPGWVERPVPSMIRRELATREANSLLAANRKAWSLKHNALDSTDVAILDDLLDAVGVGAAPFYYDSTESTDDPRLMRISNLAPRREQDHPAPKSGDPTYQVEIEMLEQTS